MKVRYLKNESQKENAPVKQSQDLERTNEAASYDDIEVHHLKDSGKDYPPQDYGYGAWKDFWREKKKGRKFPSSEHICPCHQNNENNPEITEFVGAHVIDKDGNMYVTPTCDACNKKAINDESFRNKWFSVRRRDLVLFCPDELKKERQKR